MAKRGRLRMGSWRKYSAQLYVLLAYTSLGIGMLGLVVPGLPTTEFVLLAAWAAGKGSPRLAAWLESHRIFGSMLYQWRHGRVIPRRAKCGATLSMLVCILIMTWAVSWSWFLGLAVLGMSFSILWIWSRPEVLPSSASDRKIKAEPL